MLRPISGDYFSILPNLWRLVSVLLFLLLSESRCSLAKELPSSPHSLKETASADLEDINSKPQSSPWLVPGDPQSEASWRATPFVRDGSRQHRSNDGRKVNELSATVPSSTAYSYDRSFPAATARDGSRDELASDTGLFLTPEHVMQSGSDIEDESQQRILSDPEWASHTIDSGANAAHAVWTGDLNNDGYPDVVGATFFGDEIVWYPNDGNGGFITGFDIAALNDASAVWGDDVDGDGDIDVMGCGGGGVVLIINNGDETFGLPIELHNGGGGRGITAGDVDGDGDVDIVASFYSDDIVAWFRNDGSGSFHPASPSTTSWTLQKVWR